MTKRTEIDERVVKLPRLAVFRNLVRFTRWSKKHALGDGKRKATGWFALLLGVPVFAALILAWAFAVILFNFVLGWVNDLPAIFKHEDDTDLRQKIVWLRWVSIFNTALLAIWLAAVAPATAPFSVLVIAMAVTNRITAHVRVRKLKAGETPDPFAPTKGFVKPRKDQYEEMVWTNKGGEVVGSFFWTAVIVALLVPAFGFITDALATDFLWLSQGIAATLPPEFAWMTLVVPPEVRFWILIGLGVVAVSVAAAGGRVAGLSLRKVHGREEAYRQALREKMVLVVSQESASGQKQFMTAEEAGLLKMVRMGAEWEITLPTHLWPVLRDEGALRRAVRRELDNDQLSYELVQVWEGHFSIGPVGPKERAIRANLRASGGTPENGGLEKGLTEDDLGFDDPNGHEELLPRELLNDMTSWEETAKAAASFAELGLQLVGFNMKTRKGILEPVATATPRARPKRLNLAAGASERTVRDAAESLARREKAAVIGVDVLERTVTLTPLLPAVAALRERIAELLSAGKQVSVNDIEVTAEWSAEGRAERVIVRTRAQVVDPSAARERWKHVLGQLGMLRGYRLVFDPTTGAATFEFGDPLGAGVPYRWDEPVTHTSIPAFADENGETVCLGLFERNALLGGVPGSGKSGGATAILAGISRLDGVALVGLDPKRVELSLWAPRFSVIAKHDEHATAVLEALLAEMERRYEWLDDEGLKKVPLDRLDEVPLIVVLIDELAEVVSGGVTKEDKAAEVQRSTAIRRLIAKGRAAGFVVITATQKPSANIVPTELRDLIQQRVGFATTNPSMTDVILGFGAAQLGGLSHEIPTEMPGTAYILNEGSRVPKRVRAFWIPDEDVAGIAESTAEKRVDLPFLPTEAQALAAAAAAAAGSQSPPPRRSAPAQRQSPAPVRPAAPAAIPVDDFIL